MDCAQVRGNNISITIAGPNGHLELNIFKSLLIDNILQSIKLLSKASNSFTEHCIIGLKRESSNLKTAF